MKYAQIFIFQLSGACHFAWFLPRFRRQGGQPTYLWELPRNTTLGCIRADVCTPCTLSCCYRTAFIYVSLCTVAHAFGKANQNVFSSLRFLLRLLSQLELVQPVSQSVINSEIDCSFCVFQSVIFTCTCVCVERILMEATWLCIHKEYIHENCTCQNVARNMILTPSRFDTFITLYE